MTVGAVAILPTTYGIQFGDAVGAICGTSTTMYVGFKNGRVKSLTSTGTLADLTTPVKLPGKIVAMCYTAYADEICAILDNGDVYMVDTDGDPIVKLCSLGCNVEACYYYGNVIYCILAGTPAVKSTMVSIALT